VGVKKKDGSYDPPATLLIRWLKLRPGIYLSKVDCVDGEGQDAGSVFEVLMYNNERWYWLDEELGDWRLGWDQYDPTSTGRTLFKLDEGPGKPTKIEIGE
jgi:hypothetical protein